MRTGGLGFVPLNQLPPMISLIITLIAIVLVALVALATMYFGGHAFSEGTTQAKASQLLTEGQQLQAALTLYKSATSTQATSLDQLQPTYLTTSFPNWGVTDGLVFTPQATQSVCLAFNQKVGIDTVPACSDAAYDGKTVCCTQ